MSQNASSSIFSSVYDSTERPIHHANDTRTLFRNPWETPQDEITDTNNSASANLSWLWNLTNLLSNIPLEWAKDLTGHGLSPVKVISPSFASSVKEVDSIKATWLGHASFLVELPSRTESNEKPFRLLLDPVFSDRVGPSSWVGVRRKLPTPCSLKDLPEFQLVFISHNHYDHLDFPTIQKIWAQYGTKIQYVVPIGIKTWLMGCGIPEKLIHELDWWEEISFPISTLERLSGRLSVTCTPAQHNSGRNVVDRNQSLWCGFAFTHKLDEEKVTRVYYAGDTGYMTTNGPCPVFKAIGERLGPFDCAMIPIWRGATLGFIASLGLRITPHPLLSSLHTDPGNAVALRRDVRARHAIAMHFGTFSGSDAESLEPIVELVQALADEKKGTGSEEREEEGEFRVIDIGETATVRPLWARLNTSEIQ